MKILLGIVLLTLAFNAFSQDVPKKKEKGTFSEKIYWGGGFAIDFGKNSQGYNYTNVALSPIIGYRVTDNFSVGTGLNYQFYRFSSIDVSLHQYGISPFARYNFNQFFGYGEYNVISTPSIVNGNRISRRAYQRLLIGAGYSQPIGSRSFINAMALYDVLYNPADGAFSSPWVFRIFFTF